MFIKNALLPLALVIAAPFSHAGDWYVGGDLGLLGAGNEEAEGTAWYDGRRAYDDEGLTASSFGLKVGYQFRHNARVELTRSVIKADYDHYSSENYNGFDLDAHWLIKRGQFTPFLGAGLGLYNNDSVQDDDGSDLSGISLNLLAGLQFEVADHLMLDATWKYRAIAWETIQRYNSNLGYYDLDLNTSVSIIGAGLRYYF